MLRFAVFVTAVSYNWTEAMFNGQSLVWFILLCSAVIYPRPLVQTRSMGKSEPAIGKKAVDVPPVVLDTDLGKIRETETRSRR